MAIAGNLTDWRTATHGSPTSLTDYTAKTLSVQMSLDGEEVDATTFGNFYRDFERSFINGTFEVQYKYDSTIWGVVSLLMTNGTSVDFQYSPDGTTTGKPKVTGAMVCTSMGSPASVGDLLVIDVTFRINGAVTFDSHA